MSKKKKHTCNICGYPQEIPYQEYDPETNRTVTEYHEVPCLGHIGIHPSLWNKHPQYNKYRLFRAKQKGKK